jgi:hypothetical protein
VYQLIFDERYDESEDCYPSHELTGDHSVGLDAACGDICVGVDPLCHTEKVMEVCAENMALKNTR